MVDMLGMDGSFAASAAALRSLHSQQPGADFHARKETALLVNAVQDGRFSAYVQANLASRYDAGTFARLKISHGIQTHNNIQVDVLDKACSAWSEGAQYQLVTPDGRYSDGGEFASALEVGNFDELMRTIDVLTELHPRIAVAPTVVEQERTGRRVFRWTIHDPSTFNVIPAKGNPCDFAGIETYDFEPDKQGVLRDVKTTWTVDKITKYRMAKLGKWELVSQDDNIYRAIPFVLFGRCSPSSSIWCNCPGPLLSAITIEANSWETFLSYIGSGQIKVIAGQFKEFPSGQALRHAGVLSLGDSAENIMPLDFQTNVDVFVATYITRLRQSAAVHMGLGGDEFAQGAQQPSGESLKMRYAERERRAQRKRPFLKDSLVELFWMQQHVLATQLQAGPIHGVKGTVPYDPAAGTSAATLLVDVNETVYPELATEVAAHEDRELQLGLTNRPSLYKRRNPDATEEQARQAVQDNLLLEAQYLRMAQPRAAPLGIFNGK